MAALAVQTAKAVTTSQNGKLFLDDYLFESINSQILSNCCQTNSIRVESIASEVGMSVSGFHHHFKAVTAMSPLQYQKRLRLQEARRLLLGGGLNATDVAFRVGYNDSSHFSREYKDLFGLPPKRDIDRLQAAA